MNSPMKDIFPAPGMKGVNGNYEPDVKASPGGMETPFKDGAQAFHESRGVPVKFTESIPANLGNMNTPFSTTIPMKK